MSRIIAFHLENTKEYYAHAFHYIYKDFVDNEEWAKRHIKCFECALTSKENEYREAIYKYETQSTEHLPFSGILKRDDIFYFRVNNKQNNDVINIHYFFLASKHIEKKCCLAIIPDDATDNTVETSIISSYLLFETLAYSQNNEFQIIEESFNDKKNHFTKYNIELCSRSKENIFILRRFMDRRTNKIYELYPFRVNKRKLTISHKFFPQLLIDKDCCGNLETTAEQLFVFLKNKWENRNKKNIFYKDALYSIALRSKEINLSDEKEVEKNKVIDEGEGAEIKAHNAFPLPEINLTQDVLAEYCKKCLEKAVPGIPRTLRGELRKEFIKKQEEILYFLEIKSKLTSTFAFCLFLEFWSFISEKKDEKYFDEDGFLTEDARDDLLTDAQDYADGVLQLLDNAVKHSEWKEGVLCLRIHHTDEDRHTANDSRDYLKNRYDISNLYDNNYYLEILISDYNTKSDITRTFINNIENDTEGDYEVFPELLRKIKKFKLNDLFNYERERDTWDKFYSKPKNLISHYGLLVFEHLVNFANGKFRLYSSNVNIIEAENIYYSAETDQVNNTGIKSSQIHIPGTQYEILLPIGLKHNSRLTGLNAELSFSRELSERKATFISKEIYNFITTDNNEKKDKIDILHSRITSEFQKLRSEEFPCFDVSEITTPLMTEVMTKALIKILGTEELKTLTHFAFINATDGFLSVFIRVFSLIYLKTGQNYLMEKRQVYLCSRNAEKEIVFYGNSLHDSVKATYEISSLDKGQPLHEVKILLREEEKANETMTAGDEHPVIVFPFDCVIPNLFCEKVEADLHRDIRENPFGCCLKNTHMRIGSKVHTHGNYYEASLLFSFNNYVSRFAYFLIKKSIEKIEAVAANEEAVEKIVLIGYETYSENLVITIKAHLKDFVDLPQGLEIDYIIYNEANRDNTFSRWREVKPDQHTRFIVVVPIGSTLTTHDKIVSDLKRKVESENQGAWLFSYDYIIQHHCVVLIRNERQNELPDAAGRRGLEKNFWDKIENDPSGGYVIYDGNIGTGNRIDFFICVSNEWYLPNECMYCFPKPDDILAEEPLIQANRASVVPMIMYGKKSNTPKLPYLETFAQDEERFKPLEKGLCYGHIVRDKDNHFEYYFETEKVINAIIEDENRNKEFRDQLSNWLDIYRTDEPSLPDIHNFIVAPLHDTNATFVYKVNEILKAKQIIWLDTKREYRSNIEAKYSNLRTLYDNLMNDARIRQKGAEIRFHFVDDTIVTGSAFYRAMSLLKSLFPADALNENAEGVKVCVFESVILLINRCSESTKLNYTKKGHFYGHVHLDISSMRNHCDACVVCKKYDDFRNIIDSSAATSALSAIALIEAKKFKPHDAHDSEIESLRQHGYYRLIATQRFNNKISSLHDEEKTYDVKQMIWKELDDICATTIPLYEIEERFSCAISVISKPFLTFKKSVLNAALTVILEMIEYCLSDRAIGLQGENQKRVKAFIDNSKIVLPDGKNVQNERLIKLFFECLASMNSTYLMRTHTINSVLYYCHTMGKDKAMDFINKYAFYIKQVLCLSKKDNLSVWLEKLLIQNEELYPKPNSGETVEHLGDLLPELNYLSTLKNLLRMENTDPICDALRECKKAFKKKCVWEQDQAAKPLLDVKEHDGTLSCFEKVAEETLKQYFCNTYREFASIYSTASDANKTGNPKSFAPMLYLSYLLDQTHLFFADKETDFYTKVLKLSAEILDVSEKSIGLFVLINSSSMYQLLPKPSESADEMEKLSNFVYNAKESNRILSPIGDTLFVEKSETSEDAILKSRLAAIKLVNNESSDSDINNAEFYLAFRISEDHLQNDDIVMENMIIKARNLLSMRNGLVKRLSADYDNNVLQNYVALQEQVRALANDRSGNHIPFENIFKEFTRIVERTGELIVEYNREEINKIPEIKSLAHSLEVTVDALISKLYVLGVFNQLPEPLIDEDINQEKYIELPMALNCLKDLDPLFDCFTNKQYKLKIEINPKIISQQIYLVENASHLWPMMLIALMLNALYHGYEEDTNIVNCKIELYPDNDAPKVIRVENRYLKSEKRLPDGITRKALVKFFDMLTKLDGIKIDETQLAGLDGKGNKIFYYRVDIPITEKEGE